MPTPFEHELDAFPIGNRPLAAHRGDWRAAGWHADPRAWLDPAELDAADTDTLADPDGTPLAWRGEAPTADTSPATRSFLIRHPWQLLRANEACLDALAADPDELAERRATGQVHALALVDADAHLGPGTRVLPGVVIEGAVVIGADCKIGPNCYLRGRTSIGDRCHVGNAVEIKNSILLADTNVGHLSYIGDSILGSGVNLGAGTITSNLRHDGRNHRCMVDGELVDTGRRKFGALIGDRVHTGIHTSIYPGRQLFPGTTTRPGEIVQHDLHPR